MKKLVYFILLLWATGCKEKYDLPFEQPVSGYLVIEGVINSSGDSTFIELSRTSKINSGGKEYEHGAMVQVEGEDNSSSVLTEINTGIYSKPLSLDNNTRYRLRIKTREGKEYLSDYEQVKITPAIDSISFQKEGDGIWLQFNTHDPNNDTRYYKWDYHETWEFLSEYGSFLKFSSEIGTNGRPTYWIGFKDSVRFSQDTAIYRCWRSASSTSLLLGSSAKLSNDLIYRLPFLYIPAGDKRISELYSIYVRQYALTKEAYEFLEKMKKNTEENGSIFDPQPSQLKGNIHCITTPEEPVIGYISISTISEKRLFISPRQLPFWNYRSGCEEEPVRNNPDSIAVASQSGAIPTRILEMVGNSILYFGVSTPECVDCTRTGTNVKPAFWP